MAHKEDFDSLWEKYINHCKYILKLEYNTYHKKEILYNKYLKNKFNKVSKIKKEFICQFIDELSCSDKQKNEIIKILKPFFNWCIEEEILLVSPLYKVKEYTVTKTEMKYWTPEELK